MGGRERPILGHFSQFLALFCNSAALLRILKISSGADATAGFCAQRSKILGRLWAGSSYSRSHSLRCRTGQLCSVWLPDHRRRARHLAPWCAKTAAISPQKKASPRQQRCPPPRSHSPLGALSHKAGWPSINQSVNDMTQAHWPISAIASRSAWRYESAPAWIPAQYLERWYTSSSEGRAV